MLSSSLLSTFHLLALSLGLPAIALRTLWLGSVTEGDGRSVKRVLMADNAWGLSGVLLLLTGLTRAFGPFEKGSGFYLHNGAFMVKMALFALVLLLELVPMVGFIRWRIASAKKSPLDFSKVPLYRRIGAAELLLTLAIPFFASMMARGIGFTWFGF